MATKPFDFRSLNKYLSAKAADDFNRFIETVPQNAGKTALIAAGIAWAAVAAIGLFSMLQTQKITELRGQLEATEALQPMVPVMKMTAVPDTEITAFIEKAKILYPGLTFTNSANIITVQSQDTSAYAQLREMMGHIVSGGNSWKVSINSLCIGRECPQRAMEAALRVEKVSIEKPDVAAPAAESPEGQATPVSEPSPS